MNLEEKRVEVGCWEEWSEGNCGWDVLYDRTLFNKKGKKVSKCLKLVEVIAECYGIKLSKQNYAFYLLVSHSL